MKIKHSPGYNAIYEHQDENDNTEEIERIVPDKRPQG